MSAAIRLAAASRRLGQVKRSPCSMLPCILASPQNTAAMAKTCGQAKPKRQPKQPDKYDPGKQGKQQGVSHTKGPGHAARAADALLQATSKQATKVKAAWRARLFTETPFTETPFHTRRSCLASWRIGPGTVFMGPGVWGAALVDALRQPERLEHLWLCCPLASRMY
jgi:hypothetical protein